MTDTIMVKPHPDLDPRAHKLIVHPTSGGLLDAAGKIPEDGRPWHYDGVTCRHLVDKVIARADDPMFAKPKASEPASENKPDPKPDPSPAAKPLTLAPAKAADAA